MTTLIQASDLLMRYGDREILSRIDFSVEVGEMVAIIGPNGAGKTTLLSALSGESRLGGGAIKLQGTLIGNHSARELALRRAVLPQSSSLLFHFTAYEVVRLGLDCAREAGAVDAGAAMVADALTQVGVAHLSDRYVPTLSGGERQRVHLARCLVQLRASPRIGAKLLMLDEPTASLDPAHQHRVMTIARAFARAGNATIAVVHDLSLAAAYADRVVVLDSGRIVHDGSAEDGLTTDLLAEVFDLETEVFAHPRTGRPVILQTGAV